MKVTITINADFPDRDTLADFTRVLELTTPYIADNVGLIWVEEGSDEPHTAMDARKGTYMDPDAPLPGRPAACDDCYRTDGTHDPDVEH